MPQPIELRRDGSAPATRHQPEGVGSTAWPVLLLAFTFAVMADPVSLVAHAIEAALQALVGGDLALLLPIMALVVAIIAVIIGNYQQLVARYPQGGGPAAAAGEAFGEAWSFVPIGALIVNFALTISSAPPPAPPQSSPTCQVWRPTGCLWLNELVSENERVSRRAD